MDFALEFRSQIELAVRLENDIRVGVSFSHISNASFGEENPGVESLALTYVIPFWKVCYPFISNNFSLLNFSLENHSSFFSKSSATELMQ